MYYYVSSSRRLFLSFYYCAIEVKSLLGENKRLNMWQYFRKPRCRLTSSSLRSCTFDVVLSLEFTSSKFKFRIAAESVSKSLKKQRKQSTTEYSSSIIQLLWYGRRGSRKGKGSFLYTIDFYFSAPPTSFVWQRKKKNGS